MCDTAPHIDRNKFDASPSGCRITPFWWMKKRGMKSEDREEREYREYMGYRGYREYRLVANIVSLEFATKWLGWHLHLLTGGKIKAALITDDHNIAAWRCEKSRCAKWKWYAPICIDWRRTSGDIRSTEDRGTKTMEGGGRDLELVVSDGGVHTFRQCM